MGFMLQCSNSAQSNYLTLTTVLEIIMLTAEQIMASHKANIETLFGLTQKAFEGVEKAGRTECASHQGCLG